MQAECLISDVVRLVFLIVSVELFDDPEGFDAEDAACPWRDGVVSSPLRQIHAVEAEVLNLDETLSGGWYRF